VAERREQWRESRKDLSLETLVFIDESGAQTNMTRLRGRCAQGERLVSFAPHGHWSTTTVIGAIRISGPCAAAIVDGPVDADIFRVYVQHVLVPTLHEGDIVVLDNLQPHKASGVREMIEAAGASLLYLPPYSPDFNPIEAMWSKVKQSLRCAAARTKEALQESVWNALDLVRVEDCIGFFRHCGYIAT